MVDRPLLRHIAFMRRNRCSVLVATLCLFILVNPLLAHSPTGRLIASLCMVAIMVLAVWAIRLRRMLVWVSLLALLAAAAIAGDRLGMPVLRVVAYATTAGFIAIVTVTLLVYVLDWHTITVDKVFGAVAAYILIAFTFASLFGLLQMLQPNAFHVAAANEPDGHLGWHDMLYFSFTVLTSTGFGEITPVTNAARSVIIIEQVLGVMYVAFLVARLANLYGRPPPE
jgi:hypothetical protein